MKTKQRYKKSAAKFFLFIFAMCLFILSGCTSCSDGEEEKNLQNLLLLLLNSSPWRQISTPGGFVSSIAYHPSRSGEIWASGDDASGIYRSVDGGATWGLIRTTPPDHSTYSLVIDPNNSDTIYAPNHFGRGVLKTTDSGTTWTLLTSGLPTANADKRVYDMAIDPAASNKLYLCLSGGLYKSTDSGMSFSQVTNAVFTANSDSNFKAVVISSSSRIFVGTQTGRIYNSVNDGADWTEITNTASFPTTDLALTDNALYIAYATGYITRTTDFTNATLTLINNGATGDIEDGMWTKIAAVSGASQASDTLYIGTVYKSGSTKWGFFVSTDGGSTYTKRMTGLDDNSTFSLAVNPADANTIILGTVNGGIFKTTDQGVNWSLSTSGIYATDSYAFCEDPSNANHLLVSSTAGLTGTSKFLETSDLGTTWSEISFFGDKSVQSILIHPADPNIILAGTFHNGIYKTTAGSGGTWSQVFTKNIEIRNIRRDRKNSAKLYAVSNKFASPAVSGDMGVYYSSDSGSTWGQVINFAVLDVIAHPENEDEAVLLTADVFATTDHFNSVLNSLGLAAFAPGKYFIHAAFDESNPSILIVGTTTGELYKTENYNSSGAGVTWVQVATPAVDVGFNGVVVKDSLTWYVACWTGDEWFTASSTPGVMRTADGGATWTFLNSGLFPGRLVYRFRASHSVANRFFAGMWGGGFMMLQL